jgi:hypothetical protein
VKNSERIQKPREKRITKIAQHRPKRAHNFQSS